MLGDEIVDDDRPQGHYDAQPHRLRSQRDPSREYLTVDHVLFRDLTGVYRHIRRGPIGFDILGELVGTHPDPGDVPRTFDHTSSQGSSLHLDHVTCDLLRRRCEVIDGVRVDDGVFPVEVLDDVKFGVGLGEVLIVGERRCKVEGLFIHHLLRNVTGVLSSVANLSRVDCGIVMETFNIVPDGHLVTYVTALGVA